MAVRVTLTCVLPEIWGADEAWDNGGPEAVKELLWKDIAAFAEDAEWTMEKTTAYTLSVSRD